MCFFTVIIPSYNRADLISIAIESVLNQSYQDFELIIIDNASSDNTSEIVKMYTDSRIIFIQNVSNLERCASRNIGIENAKGKYVTLLDSDDYYLNDHLLNFYNEIKSKNFPKALFFVNKLIFQNKELSKAVYPKLINNPVEYFFLNPVIPGQVCIEKSILNQFQFRNDVLIIEDATLWMQIATTYPIYQLQTESIVYLIHDNNSVNEKNNNVALKRLNGLKIIVNEKNITRHLSRASIRFNFSDCYTGIYRHYSYNNSEIKMIITLLLSIIKYPEVRFKMKLYSLLGVLPLTSAIIKWKENLTN